MGSGYLENGDIGPFFFFGSMLCSASKKSWYLIFVQGLVVIPSMEVYQINPSDVMGFMLTLFFHCLAITFLLFYLHFRL